METSRITSIDLLEEVVNLQKEVWGFSDQDCLPSHILLASNKIGGMILGCYNHRELLGFSQTLPAIDGNLQANHYLHALGVKPNNRASNVGFSIMKAHRLISLDQRIHTIKWTFDPLESINANLYIKKLGACIKDYIPNYYGSHLNGINEGIATDRFLVSWELDHPKTLQRINGIYSNCCQKDIKEDFVTISILSNESSNLEKNIKYAIEIPTDFQIIKEKHFSKAVEIRMNSRRIFMALIQIQKRITDFVLINENDQRRAYYLTE